MVYYTGLYHNYRIAHENGWALASGKLVYDRKHSHNSNQKMLFIQQGVCWQSSFKLDHSSSQLQKAQALAARDIEHKTKLEDI